MDWKTCFKEKKILVAEDDTACQDLMKDVFEQMNCPIDLAKDGNEAVEKFKSGHFDLVILDVRMPNKDGMQAVAEMRSFESSGKHTPILALTASVVEGRATLLSAGFDEVLEKPINLENLRNKMAKFLLGGS